MNEVYNFVYDWQTLITGLLAVGIGWKTVSKMQAQIEQNRKQFNNKKKTQALKAQAKVPHALSAFISYLEEIAKGDDKIKHFSNEYLNDLIEAIEFLDTNKAIKLKKITDFFQIFYTRYKSGIFYKDTEEYGKNWFYSDVFTLIAASNELFSEMRGLDYRPAITKEEKVTQARQVLNCAEKENQFIAALDKYHYK